MSEEQSGIYVATESGASQVGDDIYTFTKGITRLRGGHPLLDVVPDYFEPIEEHLHYSEPHMAAVEEPASEEPLETPVEEPLEYEPPNPENTPHEVDIDEVLAGNVDEVSDMVAQVETHELLDRLEAAEIVGSDRVSVRRAIEARREELAPAAPPSEGTTARRRGGRRRES